ncbi:bifunctional orotidine-5'-phosphate decarboxylase/orotate phosphoribosyltransferase [Oscillatoria amoena NRMC-F 0135]|nr:bifunctional orotidine-5'-phosphate decarboxylase/orotate phosphoribosyltransferase [Geitlerinema splendidum]MDL5047556.1 bifunctional orotidine-5'-phosphate decarboxylase/orotate phosphoribosyltransferase [Oscillatoria amoena NRMC-F 0135]
MSFFEKYSAATERNRTHLYISLDPDPELLEPSDNDSLWDWLHFLIAQTADLVCAYKLTLDFYQSLGVVGFQLLQQTLKAIPRHLPIILDAKHSDINTSTVFARTVFEDWRVDACTIVPFGGLDHVAPFLVYPDKAVFVLSYTGNSSGDILQEHPSPDNPFYLQLIQASQSWGSPEQLGLEVSAAKPEVLAKIRSYAPERLILAVGEYSTPPDYAQSLIGGGEGLLLPVSPDLLLHKKPGEAVDRLRTLVEQEHQKAIAPNSSCQLWVPNVCFLRSQPHRDLILQLYDIGCITFGDHVQASGEVFPYYIDLRKLISQPQTFHLALTAYAEILETLKFDRIAGIPYGSLPTATGLALRLGYPMIFPRKEVKAYGAKRLVEGHYEPGERIVVVDDILISGKSVMEGAQKLQSVGLEVKDIVVLIDHGRGVKDRLKQNGYNGYSVLTLSEIADTLLESGRITLTQFELIVSQH